MIHAMIDLETLGTRPGSVILSIGAVKFDDSSDAPFSEFSTNISAESCVAVGLTIDASTVLWWMKQSDEARKAITDRESQPLAMVLSSFKFWLRVVDCVWGNGAAFDNALLRSAYEAVGLACPWSYRSDRCYRTLKAQYPNIQAPTGGTLHNSLDDARNQALHLIQILKAVKS